MRISLPAGRAKIVARTAVIAITLASGGVVGVSSASASGGGCTDSNPEVCFGVSGTGDFVNWLQVQVHVNSAGKVAETISGPTGWAEGQPFTQWQTMTGAGWTAPFTWTVNNVESGWFCGSVSFNGSPAEDYKCVDVT